MRKGVPLGEGPGVLRQVSSGLAGISGLYAVRVAARLRRELETEVEMVRGGVGEFKVLVDGDTVIEGGAFSSLGVLPSGRKIGDAVRTRLAR